MYKPSSAASHPVSNMIDTKASTKDREQTTTVNTGMQEYMELPSDPADPLQMSGASDHWPRKISLTRLFWLSLTTAGYFSLAEHRGLRGSRVLYIISHVPIQPCGYRVIVISILSHHVPTLHYGFRSSTLLSCMQKAAGVVELATSSKSKSSSSADL